MSLIKEIKEMLSEVTKVNFKGNKFVLKVDVNEDPNKKGIILGTAHPLKFPTVVKELIKKEIEVPENIKSLMQKEKKSILIPDNYVDIKKTINNIIDFTPA